jgi:type 1 fimbria pilin
MALRKRMTMDANRNSSYSPDKIAKFQNSTATSGFGLQIKKNNTNIPTFIREKTPMSNNTPSNKANKAF